MIPANKDQSYLIKENEQDYWHVEITRKTVDPANAKNIISNSFVQVFDTANFNKIFRPFYYMDFKDSEMKELLKELYDWQDYGGKHAENIYTNFVGSYYLPYKFDIDKRILYLSALVRSGQITKGEAKIKYSVRPSFDDFKPINKRLHIDCRIYPVISNTHDDFKTYHSQFKKWKLLFWLMVKLQIFPRTFYTKYCN